MKYQLIFNEGQLVYFVDNSIFTTSFIRFYINFRYFSNFIFVIYYKKTITKVHKPYLSYIMLKLITLYRRYIVTSTNTKHSLVALF